MLFCSLNGMMTSNWLVEFLGELKDLLTKSWRRIITRDNGFSSTDEEIICFWNMKFRIIVFEKSRVIEEIKSYPLYLREGATPNLINIQVVHLHHARKLCTMCFSVR